jgi:hypothetical protein
MIKNKTDKTIALYFGDMRLLELPAGWSFTFHPEIEDFLAIKYADLIEKNPPENELLKKIKAMIRKRVPEIEKETEKKLRKLKRKVKKEAK